VTGILAALGVAQQQIVVDVRVAVPADAAGQLHDHVMCKFWALKLGIGQLALWADSLLIETTSGVQNQAWTLLFFLLLPVLNHNGGSAREQHHVHGTVTLRKALIWHAQQAAELP